MAAAACSSTESDEQVEKVSLRVMVDKGRNKVLYAEAGNDFVDALFSFLTLPLGTIARLVVEESNIEAVKFGSISSLYQSVKDIDKKCLWNETCKEMLLKPRNSMEAYCQQLKLNMDDTPVQYFFCSKCSFSFKRTPEEHLLSIFRNKNCFCGKVLDKLSYPEYLNLEKGFVNENTTFIISDDLYVMPNIFGASLQMLQKHGVDTFDAVEEQIVDINKKNVLDLLKLSLLSKTPLSDIVLKKQSVEKLSNPSLKFPYGGLPSDEGRQMSVKVTLRKSNEEILFIEAEEDFIDFVLSFLTFPLGGVLHILEGFSSISCIHNLYKSMTELSPERYLISKGIKDKLSMPQCFPQFEISSQILPIAASSLSAYFHLSNGLIAHSTDITEEMICSKYNDNFLICISTFVPFKLVDPYESSIAKTTFARGPLMYMVTDDLSVTPMSSISTSSYLKRSKVPLSDLEERVIKIGVKEGLGILKASLISTSALTNGLKQFIRTVKVEK